MPAKAGGRLTKLDVITVSGYRADMLFADTGLPWVLPSPNMPTPDTALLYAGTGLFEATNLSEGRGTTRPFEIIGAPYVDYRWAQALNRRKLPGVWFREMYFTPTASKNANTVCGRVQVHILDPRKVHAIRTAVEMMVSLRGDDRGRLAFGAGGIRAAPTSLSALPALNRAARDRRPHRDGTPVRGAGSCGQWSRTVISWASAPSDSSGHFCHPMVSGRGE